MSVKGTVILTNILLCHLYNNTERKNKYSTVPFEVLASFFLSVLKHNPRTLQGFGICDLRVLLSVTLNIQAWVELGLSLAETFSM